MKLQPRYRRYQRIGCPLLIAALCLLPHQARAAESGEPFEAPPLLQAADLLPDKLLQGPRHRIEPEVPTDGFLTWFTLRSDFGDFKASSPRMAAVRVNEIEALAELEKLSKSEVFAEGLKRSAQEFGGEVKQLVTHPKETLSGVPEGVGRFFKRVKRGATTGFQKLGDLKQDDPESGAVIPGPGSKLPGAGSGDPQTAAGSMGTGEATARMAGKTTADVFGYDDQRRKIAKQLRIDPYTTNGILADKLNEIAWTAFAGGLGFTAVKTLAPASAAITLTTGAADWVWDTPPGDLRVQNEQILLGLGADPQSVDRFLRHPWYSLTLQSRLTRSLERMPRTEGRADLMPLALSVRSFDQARFVVDSVAMLADCHQSRQPISRLEVAGTVWGHTARGIVVAAPAEGISWSADLNRFARRDEFKAAPQRLLLVRGNVTAKARQELAALGWTVEEGVQSDLKSEP